MKSWLIPTEYKGQLFHIGIYNTQKFQSDISDITPILTFSKTETTLWMYEELTLYRTHFKLKASWSLALESIYGNVGETKNTFS